MSATKVVKRYANRKLYDTERSCYVTLEDISHMIKAGDEVRVMDNKSGEDLTSVTLAQIIFETEKKKKFMPLSLLRDLIQNGSGTLTDLARDGVDRVQAQAAAVRESAQKLRSDLGDRLDRAIGSEATGEGGTPRLLSELLLASQKTFGEFQRGVEERVKGPVGTVTRYANLGSEVAEVQRRLAELENRLEGEN